MNPAQSYDFQEQAEIEAQEAADFYEDILLNLGERFEAAFNQVLDDLLANPEGYPFVDEEARRCRLKSFPYRFIYDYDPDRQHVDILAFAHEKCRFGYWRNRRTS